MINVEGILIYQFYVHLSSSDMCVTQVMTTRSSDYLLIWSWRFTPGQWTVFTTLVKLIAIYHHKSH